MRSIASILILTIFLFPQLQAQRIRYGILKGTVIDSASRQPIEAATVSVFLVTDSSLINYDITNKKGEFIIRDIPQAKHCRVLVSYSGFGSLTQDFVVAPETKELTLNPVQLKKSYTELEEVIVSARRPPILFKKDTLEFDAGSFKTAPNSVVEELLKQLPGVEVDEEGNITVNGKRVTKITVNGRDFFGDNFKVTTKNLPRDIIDKIQVVDFKTRFEQYSKTKTGNEDKVINLVLKKETNKGVFGRGTAAYGSQKRYESGANLNYFNGPLQLSLVGYTNNINQSSFGGGPTSGTGDGIMEAKGTGLNFNNEFGKKLKLNGSHFFNNSHQVNASTTRRQNMLPDTAFIYDAAIHSTNDRDEHRLNVKTEYKPDSATTVTADVVHDYATVAAFTAHEAMSSSLQGKTINAASNLFSTRSKENNTSLELFVGRRLNQKGRSIQASLNYSNNNRRSWDVNKGNTVFYKTDSSHIRDILDQQSVAMGNYTRFGVSASYIEPLFRSISLELRYSFAQGKGGENKYTNRFNPITGQYLVDTIFSNTIHTGYRTHFPFMSLSYWTAKFNISLGTAVQWIRQQNSASQTKFHLVQHYSNVFPFATIIYQYSSMNSIYLTYTGRSQQPSIDQLQTVPDNRNTLYIRLGNPHLKASFFHNLNISWRQSSQKAFWNARLGLGTAKNQVVYETWFDSVQYSRPINANGNYNLTGNFSFSRTWRKKDWSLRLSLAANGYYNRNVSFSNKLKNISGIYSLSPTLGLSGTYKQLITFNPSFSLRYHNIRNSFQSVQPAANLTKTITLSTMVNWPKRFIWENNIQYNHNSRTAPGFPKGVTLWNMALNYQFFKQQQAMLRFSVFDLLRQNNSINRSITPTYIEDTQIQVLQQYFLVSFIYNLKEFRK